MLSRYDIVRATSEQNRSFATIGLLRQVTEATPIDMVCTYIIQTNQPWGLKNKVMDLSHAKDDSVWWSQKTVHESREADRVRRFPDGITRMAKDYLIRMFWKQIDHLRGSSCVHVSLDGSEHSGCMMDTSPARLRTFPKNVLDVLASCHIHQNSRLWDAQHAIGALHAVCTPLMLDKPSWVQKNGYCMSVDERQFDTLKNNHSRTIAALMSILDSYCWNTMNRSHIPNEAEKNILLDLIECFLIMFGPRSFSNSFRVRQIYEYARIGDLIANNHSTRGGDRCCSGVGEFVDYRNDPRNFGNEWYNGVVAVLKQLEHLSPEAAICLTSIMNFRTAACSRPGFLKIINPQPVKEVEVYLRSEFDVQRQKQNAARRIMEAFQRGEFNDDHCTSYSGCDRCMDEPCDPAPCESCC